jgi:hypothetical protein
VETAIAFQSRTTSALAAIGLQTNRAMRVTDLLTRLMVLLPSVVMVAWSCRVATAAQDVAKNSFDIAPPS